MVFVAGTNASYTYDDLNRVTGLSTSPTGYAYQRDQTGKLTSALDLNNRQVTSVSQGQ